MPATYSSSTTTYSSAITSYDGSTVSDESITTSAATGIAGRQALANGVIVNATPNATRRGFEYGTQQIGDSSVFEDDSYSAGSFSITLAGLEPSTTYYFRAFMIVDSMTYYGDWESFTTATPSYNFLINGVDRTADVVHDTLKIIDNKDEEVNTCQFDFVNLSLGNEIQNEDEIMVIHDGITIFSGKIKNKTPYKHGIIHYSCEASDYTAELGRFLVAETYTNMTDKEIIDDLVEKYCPGLGITTNNVIEGVTIDQITFNYLYVDECITKLTQYTARHWYIDYAKDIHYFALGEETAPVSTLDEDSNDYINLNISTSNDNIKNRVYVRGGTELSDPYPVSIVADGEQRQFLLPDKPHNLSMTQNGVTKTIGIKNIDDPGAFEYLLNFQEKYVECGTNTTTPANGTIMIFTYEYDIPILVAVEDAASIEDVGVYEFLITDKDITTTDAARARAQAELTDYAKTLVDGSFETYTIGYRSGQSIRVTLLEYGISDEYIVQSVEYISLGGGTFRYKISITNSRKLGIIRFLINMLDASQNKLSLDEDEVVDELATITDSLDSLADSLVIDSTGPYFSWFDSLGTPGSGNGKYDLAQWK